MEIDRKRTGRKSPTLAREDENLSQSGLRGERRRRQYQRVLLPGWMGMVKENELKLNPSFHHHYYFFNSHNGNMKVEEKNRFDWRGWIRSVRDGLN